LLLVVGMTVGLQRWTGFVFLFGLTGYLVYAYRQERTAGAVAGDHTAAFGKAEAFEAVDPALRPGRSAVRASPPGLFPSPPRLPDW
jgi:hypothetical protein